MPDISMQKKQLREFFLKTRQELSEKYVQEKSQMILKRVFDSHEFKEAQNVHTYISIKKNNEVDTVSLIHQCFENNKRVVVPKIIGNGLLAHIELPSLNNLEVNNLGIPEPGGNEPFTVTDLDIIFVPMVAGDRFKNRLGYGKGYYDRFLKNCTALKVGLLFDCQLSEKKLPVESFDIPLDILMTETQRIE